MKEVIDEALVLVWRGEDNPYQMGGREIREKRDERGGKMKKAFFIHCFLFFGLFWFLGRFWYLS